MSAVPDRAKKPKVITGDVPALQNDYYVNNFHTLVGHVTSLYSDLLTNEEKRWYEAICLSNDEAQRLYIRLLGRKGSFFRLSRLDYSEIEDLRRAAAGLDKQGLVCCEPPQQLASLLSAFTKPELLKILELNDLRALSRPQLIQHIEQSDEDSKVCFVMRLQSQDQWICVTGHAHWMLMQLCFFGNLYQDSSEFIVSQLGASTYADYTIEPSARAFTSREQIDAHWQYFECTAVYETLNQRSGSELYDFSQTLPQPIGSDKNLLRRTDRLRVTIARQLERLGHFEHAMLLYEACVTPPARERRIRRLMKELSWDEAHQIAQSVLAKPHNEAELLVVQRLSIQCKKSLGIPFKKPAVFKPASTKLVLANQGFRVEEQARRFFAASGDCFHTENTLVNGVFGLFIWDIVFHPVPGVFFNPFQRAPADFYQPEFYQQRQELFQDRFKELTCPVHFRSRIELAFNQHFGKQNPLVRWQGLSVELLELSLERIPISHWQAMFDRILLSTRENTNGFPDLVHFPDSGGYEFIEIKGPGDVLQENQRRWMKYFDQHDIACRVVHVSYRAITTNAKK